MLSANYPPLPTALEMRLLPDRQQLSERIERMSAEHGLIGAEPGVSEIMDQAIQVRFMLSFQVQCPSL